MFEYSGNAHMHTPYSDGKKWHNEIAEEAISAGLDFIIVTDHNVWVDGLEGYYENDKGRVLLLVGEEVHDMTREPQANHFLAYGADRELAPYAKNPQNLIDETLSSGGFGFLAHPFDPASPEFGEDSLGWQDWDIDGYSGLEIWNYMSNFKSHLTSKWHAVRAAIRPDRYIIGPEVQTLKKWDALLMEGKRIAAIGNSDAHGLTYKMGPISRVVFPYEYLFRSVNTHIMIKEALNGDLIHDKKMVIEALGNGNSWIGYDLPQRTEGFRFSAQSKTKGIMGDDVQLGSGATLQVKTPVKCHMRLIHCGDVITECFDEANLTHIPIETGAYRVECYIEYLGQERGWIFSNPVYLL